MTGAEESSSDGVRRASGSGDARLVGALVAATLALGFVGILAVPFISAQDRSGDFVESYTATLHRDGTLEETYVYTLKSSDTRMLFRFWEEQLSLNIYLNGITLVRINAPVGSIAYIKNYFGQVTILPSSSASADEINTISELAYLNEAGCYNPGYFPPGSYTISYTFKLNFRIESDYVHDHLNLMLAREHLPYKNVMIVLEDAGYISEVYQHPPSLKVAREGDDIVISGSSAENEMLEIEMLMTTGTHGFKTYHSEDSDINSLTEQANSLYSTQYWSAYCLGYIAKAAVILTPFLFLGLWIRYGRDEDVTVPPYLSTVPNPDRKPWLVNLVFNKGVNDMDEDGFYATLLDLDRRKKIRIEPKEEGMRIHILDSNVDDSYENRTLEFLGTLATSDAASPNPQKVFDTDILKQLEKQISGGESNSQTVLAQSELSALTQTRPKTPIFWLILPLLFLIYALFFFYVSGNFWESGGLLFFTFFGIIMVISFIMNILRSRSSPDDKFSETSKTLKEVSNSFYVQESHRIKYLSVMGALLLAASIIIYLWAPVVSYLLVTPIILGIVSLIQVAAAYFSPPTIFGRWKDGMFKEKLEWDAFRAHLSDYSQLNRYSTEDLHMWGIWLVYGTALGVGDKVAKVMKEFNIKLDAVIVATIAHTHFHPMIAARPMVSSGGRGHGGGHRGGGGHGGGGHGGGGGRGRGGAGRR